MSIHEPDDIREAVIAQADRLGLTAYAIAKKCDGSPGNEAVRRYLTRRCSLNTRYVSKICDVLGLRMTRQ